MSDRMTPIKRMSAYNRGAPVDRLPCVKVRLMGNVKPSEVMLESRPADVRIAVRECVRKAYDNPRGYIVASGCSLPTETPFGNIQAMLDAVREIGYPVKMDEPEGNVLEA